jgi:hypothetical protein
MDRRKALHLTAGLLGTTIFGGQAFLSGCTAPKTKKGVLSAADIPLLNAVADVILPETPKAPGAKQANVGAFILSIVRDCYSDEEVEIFDVLLQRLESDTIEKHKKPFLELDRAAQNQIMLTYDEEARAFEAKKEPHFYSMLLQLTLWGYFASEPGATQALRYNPIPGRFEGCVPYSKNQPAWA